MSLVLDDEPYYDSRLQRYVDPRKALEVVSMDYCKTRTEYKNAWRRRTRQYVCISNGCDLVWHDPGSAQKALKHTISTGHKILRGNPDGKHKVMPWRIVA